MHWRVESAVPIVVATEAPKKAFSLEWDADGIANPLLCNAESLTRTLAAAIAEIPQQSPLDAIVWAKSGYKPTPTIIECEIASNCDPLPRLKHLIDYS